MSDWVNWQQFYELNAPSVEAREEQQRAEQEDLDHQMAELERRARIDIEAGNRSRRLMDYSEYADLMRQQQAKQAAWQQRSQFDSLLGNRAPQQGAHAAGAAQRVANYGQQAEAERQRRNAAFLAEGDSLRWKERIAEDEANRAKAARGRFAQAASVNPNLRQSATNVQLQKAKGIPSPEELRKRGVKPGQNYNLSGGTF